ncbi:MAG: grasp-with-spasm system ATP-grasp peptide maturase [Fluviicola sp.]|nr:grasp-with-spasm system ATP-grasp peptide maturase [Fluviicola sp.]MBP6270928.1 grasp-with-spasm system ATP-grasp peptide maturase [Fluviicola sp.]
MILILSSYMDASTNVVIDWLKALGHQYIRINAFDELSNNINSLNITNENSDVIIESMGITFNLKDIHVIWYRRSDMEHDSLIPVTTPFSSLKMEINHFLIEEFREFRSSFYSILRNKYWLGHPKLSHVNKILQLEIAREVGLKIPETIITTKKQELYNFLTLHTKIICKPVKHIKHFDIEDKMLTVYTIGINADDISKLPDKLPPSIIQKNIEKSIELRIFYLDGKCYSMGIDSQKMESSVIDFRNLDDNEITRRFPIKISSSLEKKIDLLMKKLNLNTGSLDIIISKDDEAYFLEVNPVGQFGMISHPCGYNLEKKIAEFLVEKDKQYEQKN